MSTSKECAINNEANFHEAKAKIKGEKTWLAEKHYMKQAQWTFCFFNILESDPFYRTVDPTRLTKPPCRHQRQATRTFTLRSPSIFVFLLFFLLS